ncbi:FAD binding domain-containing protein [Chloroflexota bacterium]
MPLIRFEYQAPEMLEEVLSILDRRGDQISILAGGTDLVVQMKHGQTCPALIVDLKRIPALNRLEWSEGEGIHIGATVPLNKLISFPPFVERFGILTQACSLIGSIQIRNRATMGGNICNAAPSADTVPPLLCLGAKASVARFHETHIIPLEDFFLAPGRTVIDQSELLVEIEIPTPSTPSAGCYLRHTSREEMDIAVVGVASFLVLAPQGNILQDARIALGAVAPTPIRARQAEAILIGSTPTKEVIEETAERAAEASHPISDMRGSAEYRRELVKVLTRRTLQKACEALGIKI